MPDSTEKPASLSAQGRTAQILMGVIFLIAGLPKTWDPALFYWDVVPYTFLLGLEPEASSVVARAALSLGPIESLLGISMVLNWKRAMVFPVATAMMVGFTALMTYAWMNGYDESCGCFGTLLERGAGAAVVEDVLMLGLVVFAWYADRGSVSRVNQADWIVTGAAFVLLVGGAVQVSAGRERMEGSDLKPGVSVSDVSITDEAIDVGVGEHTIVIMTPTCVRCRRAVPKLNALSENPDIPDVVALTHYDQDSEQMIEMRETLSPLFPVLTVTKKDFMRLAWGHGVPRVATLSEGVVVRVWEAHEFPTAGDIIENR